jgi:transposase
MNSRLSLPKLGWLRYRNSRQVLGRVKNVTVSLSCGKWFVSLQTERDLEQPLPRGGAVGIDLGVVRFATLSDGSFYAPLTPGKHVRAKAGLNKSILDQGWFEFRRQLEYKLSWTGGSLILVPPRNTSRRCPQCDHVSAQNRPTQQRFHCIACDFEENADRVGAINILRAGHARCACEVSDADRVRAPVGDAQRRLRDHAGLQQRGPRPLWPSFPRAGSVQGTGIVQRRARRSAPFQRGGGSARDRRHRYLIQ